MDVKRKSIFFAVQENLVLDQQGAGPKIRYSFLASRIKGPRPELLKDDVDGTKDLNIRLILRMKTICYFSCLIRPYRLVHSPSPQALNPLSTISRRAMAFRKTF